MADLIDFNEARARAIERDLDLEPGSITPDQFVLIDETQRFFADQKGTPDADALLKLLCCCRIDIYAHGDLPALQWFLDQMLAASGMEVADSNIVHFPRRWDVDLPIPYDTSEFFSTQQET